MKRNGWFLIVGLALMAAGCGKSESPGEVTNAVKRPGAANGPAAPAAPADVAPDVYVQGIVDSFAAGNTGALWNALPAKYQADIKTVKDEFASKMDAEVWNKAFGLVGKLANALKSKKDFILNNTTMPVPAEQKAAAQKSWDDVVGILSTLANSEIKTLDGLKAADPGSFLGSTGGAVATGIIKAAETSDPNAKAQLDKVRKAKVTLVKRDGDTAVLKLETEGEKPEEESYTKVDGKWLPTDMVKDWDKKIADVKADLGSMAIPAEQKTMVLGMIGQVESVVDKLAAAKDQAEFDKEMGGAMFQLLPLLGAFGGGGAMSGPPGAMTGPGGAVPPVGLGGESKPSISAPPGTVPPTTVPPTTPPATTPAVPK